MNNQKETKLKLKDAEIARLKKDNNFLAGEIKFIKNGSWGNGKRIDELESMLEKKDGIITDFKNDLTKIKSHWLYKFINWFK